MNATCRFLVGDSLTVLRTLPDASVDLALSSPPFLGLRSYLPADHPDKASEIGSEATPGEFIDTLLDIVEECARVLAPHGSLCLELGDTYAGSGGSGGDYAPGGWREGEAVWQGTARSARESSAKMPWKGERSGWPLSKSLCLIPELLRLSLAYGFNPLTGRETDRWRVRNVVRWTRPNPPVGALGDKWRPATSEMVVACKSRTRYFDLDSCRTINKRTGEAPGGHHVRGDVPANGKGGGDFANPAKSSPQNPAGAPPLDWWEIPTQGYAGAHFATWPKALCVRPILSMCPERVCTECGEPSRRVTEATHDVERSRAIRAARLAGKTGKGINGSRADGGASGFPTTTTTTTGWTDCGHDSWRPGVVLDPFGGSGTTGMVSTGNGRSCLLVDLDERNALLAQERVGMFLDVSGVGEPLPDWLVSPRTQAGARADA